MSNVFSISSIVIQEIFDFSETVVHSDISSNVLEMLIIWLGDHKSDTTNASKLKYLKISQCDMILATVSCIDDH